MIAAAEGHREVCTALIAKGADLDITDDVRTCSSDLVSMTVALIAMERLQAGKSAVVLALEVGEEEIVHLLVTAGADINVADSVRCTYSKMRWL